MSARGRKLTALPHARRTRGRTMMHDDGVTEVESTRHKLNAVNDLRLAIRRLVGVDRG